MEAFFRGSHTTNFVTCGFSRSYNQAAQVPSSNVTCKSPRSPSINCRIMLALVSITHSITIFPASFMTAIEMLSLCTSMPIYLVLVIRAFLSGRVEPSTQNLLQKGRPLYCVALPDKWIWPKSTCPVSALTRHNRVKSRDLSKNRTLASDATKTWTFAVHIIAVGFFFFRLRARGPV